MSITIGRIICPLLYLRSKYVHYYRQVGKYDHNYRYVNMSITIGMIICPLQYLRSKYAHYYRQVGKYAHYYIMQRGAQFFVFFRDPKSNEKARTDYTKGQCTRRRRRRRRWALIENRIDLNEAGGMTQLRFSLCELCFLISRCVPTYIHTYLPRGIHNTLMAINENDFRQVVGKGQTNESNVLGKLYQIVWYNNNSMNNSSNKNNKINNNIK